MDSNDLQASSVFRSISRVSAILVLLAGQAVPAQAALLHLACDMSVTQRDALHTLPYAYYTNVDEDAGRASDAAGAYLLWPTDDGRGYVWFAPAPNATNVTWTTQYYFNRTTLELDAVDQSNVGGSGFSRGFCANS